MRSPKTNANSPVERRKRGCGPSFLVSRSIESSPASLLGAGRTGKTRHEWDRHWPERGRGGRHWRGHPTRPDGTNGNRFPCYAFSDCCTSGRKPLGHSDLRPAIGSCPGPVDSACERLDGSAPMTRPLYDILPPADQADVGADELLGRFLDYVAAKRLVLYPAQEEAIL